MHGIKVCSSNTVFLFKILDDISCFLQWVMRGKYLLQILLFVLEAGYDVCKHGDDPSISHSLPLYNFAIRCWDCTIS